MFVFETLIFFKFLMVFAFTHLLLRSIMYRDIKPENIGFDLMDEIKIIDFGLIKEYNPKRRADDGYFYHLTKETGSPQYMCPRVANGLPYNELCDVYSYCILLWQMLQLDIPYEFDYDVLRSKVLVHGPHGCRPKMNMKWSPTIRSLLSHGWSFDYSVRPSMKQICQMLDDELNRYYHNEDHHQYSDGPLDDRSHPSQNNHE
jgi:serine/threonine protein kinase